MTWNDATKREDFPRINPGTRITTLVAPLPMLGVYLDGIYADAYRQFIYVRGMDANDVSRVRGDAGPRGMMCNTIDVTSGAISSQQACNDQRYLKGVHFVIGPGVEAETPAPQQPSGA